jgi:Ankyrin repeats (3 copies)
MVQSFSGGLLGSIVRLKKLVRLCRVFCPTSSNAPAGLLGCVFLVSKEDSAAETGQPSLAEPDLLVPHIASPRSPQSEESLAEATIEGRSPTKQEPSYDATAGGSEVEQQQQPPTRSENDMPRDDQGATALHHAVQRADEPAIILLQKGADANGQDADGKTPLHRATESRNEAVVRVLIKKGADVKSGDHNGKRPASGGNNNEASVISMDHAAASASTRAYGPTPTISLPPPSLNCIGRPRLTPSLVIRHPPMPIMHLPTLPPPTPTQIDTSHTRLRSMPALPAEGPGDDEIDTDHESSGLGGSDEEDHGDVDEDQSPEPLRRRRSMPTFNRTSLPPPYPSFAPHPMPKHPIIMPREEEGIEILPSYTNAIHLTAIMPRKMEFTSPGVQAKDRKWRRVLCVLEGTVFKVYECPREASGGVINQWWEKKVGVRDVSMVNTSDRKVEAVSPRSLETPAKLGPSTSPTNWISPSRPSDSTSRPNTSQRNLNAPFSQPSGRTDASSHIYSPSQGDIITKMRQNGSLSTINSSPSRGSNATHSSMTLSASPTASASSRSHFAPIPSPRCADRRRPEQEKPVLIRAYTMQYAESGLGDDYTKRKNVIRLRLEGEQFLLQAQDVASVIEWIEVCEMCLAQNVLLIDRRAFKQQVM